MIHQTIYGDCFSDDHEGISCFIVTEEIENCIIIEPLSKGEQNDSWSRASPGRPSKEKKENLCPAQISRMNFDVSSLKLSQCM